MSGGACAAGVAGGGTTAGAGGITTGLTTVSSSSVGAAGGPRITTATLQVILNKFKVGTLMKLSIGRNKISKLYFW